MNKTFVFPLTFLIAGLAHLKGAAWAAAHGIHVPFVALCALGCMHSDPGEQGLIERTGIHYSTSRRTRRTDYEMALGMVRGIRTC